MTETYETKDMVRWQDSEGDCFFLKEKKARAGDAFILGYEVKLGDGSYHHIDSIAFNKAEAADLIQRIADFNGLDIKIKTK